MLLLLVYEEVIMSYVCMHAFMLIIIVIDTYTCTLLSIYQAEHTLCCMIACMCVNS